MDRTVYLSLGANLGDREGTIDRALELLQERIGPLRRRSDWYYSAPVGFESEHEFCNICAAFVSTLEPLELLHVTQAVERELGRTEKSIRHADGTTEYRDRTIDIDIIEYEGVAMQTEELTLPHPRYKEREFVIVPLGQIKNPAL